MKITFGGITVTLLLSLVLWASLGIAMDKVEPPAECKQCGMDRPTFARSRMMVVYADGSKHGTCSLQCTAANLKAADGKRIKSILVADYDTRQLIDAKSAKWVIGGKLPGVMSPVAKWAFAKEQAAKQFIKENGGKLATFDEALKMAGGDATDLRKHGGHKM